MKLFIMLALFFSSTAFALTISSIAGGGNGYCFQVTETPCPDGTVIKTSFMSKDGSVNGSLCTDVISSENGISCKKWEPLPALVYVCCLN